MKKLSSILLKGVIVIVLFIGGSVVLSTTTGVKTVNEAQASVSEAEVVMYLEELDYEVISADPKPNTVCDWICHTIRGGHHYWTTVYVSGGNIVDNQDNWYY